MNNIYESVLPPSPLSLCPIQEIKIPTTVGILCCPNFPQKDLHRHVSMSIDADETSMLSYNEPCPQSRMECPKLGGYKMLSRLLRRRNAASEHPDSGDAVDEVAEKVPYLSAGSVRAAQERSELHLLLHC